MIWVVREGERGRKREKEEEREGKERTRVVKISSFILAEKGTRQKASSRFVLCSEEKK